MLSAGSVCAIATLPDRGQLIKNANTRCVQFKLVSVGALHRFAETILSSYVSFMRAARTIRSCISLILRAPDSV